MTLIKNTSARKVTVNYKVFWSCLVLIGLSIPLARHQMSGQQSEVVARVGDQDITLEDVERKWLSLIHI